MKFTQILTFAKYFMSNRPICGNSPKYPRQGAGLPHLHQGDRARARKLQPHLRLRRRTKVSTHSGGFRHLQTGLQAILEATAVMLLPTSSQGWPSGMVVREVYKPRIGCG